MAWTRIRTMSLRCKAQCTCYDWRLSDALRSYEAAMAERNERKGGTPSFKWVDFVRTEVESPNVGV